MNVRLTIALIVVAAAVVAVVIINPFEQQEEAAPIAPWFYQVSMDDITEISVRNGDNYRRFFKNDARVWVFEEPDNVPADPQRWGGMTVLLSGPKTRRLLIDSPEDLGQYGLESPYTVIDVRLSGEREINVELGDETPNGFYRYGMVTGYDQLYLINDSWGDVLTRLASEPPLPPWHKEMLPETILGLSLYRPLEGDDREELRFRYDDDQWWVSGPEDVKDRKPVDAERWAEIVPLLNGPPDASIAVYNVGSAGAPYGVSKLSRTVEIRYQKISERGTEYTAKLTFRVGVEAPDGERYYGQMAYSSYPAEPVIYLPAPWTETLFALFDDIPIGELPEAADGEAEASG